MKYKDYRKKSKELSKLIKGSDANRSLYYRTWITTGLSIIGGFVAVWQLPDTIWGIQVSQVIPALLGKFIHISGAAWGAVTFTIFFLICLCIMLAVRFKKRSEFGEYLHKIVHTERPGCDIELRVADSYITNAFENYPKSAMIIGINKTFLFEESEKRSLIDDLCKHFEKIGVDKHEVQLQIDEALKKLKAEKGDKVIDTDRPKVMVRKPVPEGEEVRVGENDCEMRDNFNIGTIVGVDIKYKDGDQPVVKKL